jgi:hypothetical protein
VFFSLRKNVQNKCCFSRKKQSKKLSHLITFTPRLVLAENSNGGLCHNNCRFCCVALENADIFSDTEISSANCIHNDYETLRPEMNLIRLKLLGLVFDLHPRHIHQGRTTNICFGTI